MYVALKTINLGEGKRVAPGQPIPEALSWPYATLVAHLNLGYLKWDSKDESPVDKIRAKQNASFSRSINESAKPVFRKATTDQMTGIFGAEPLEKPEVRVNGQVAPPINVVEKKPDTINKVSVKKPAVDAEVKFSLACPNCPGRTFSSLKNLKTHTTLAHDKRK